MPGRFPLFDRTRLSVRPLAGREHGLDLTAIREPRPAPEVPDRLRSAARAILAARGRRSPVIFMMGAHVIRSGVQRYLIDLMERGLITGLAGNGACAVHDFELALIGATTESVARYIRDGRFGFWSELGQLCRAYQQGAARGWGAGQCVGELIETVAVHKDISLFAAARRLGLPFTLHMGIGLDIIQQLPECDGAALGAVSYTDFLILAREIEDLEGGFFGNFGSAVTGPEVFLKALAMARNVSDSGPRRFTTLVCDLHALPEETVREAGTEDPLYYFRPWKTLLSRTVKGGGLSYYVQGRHDRTIPALWTALNEEEGRA